jgi:outer membrane receptor protein involved in Fe transport
MSSHLRASAIVLGILLVISSSALTQEPGRISGIVVAAKDGRPLGYANVTVVDAPYGTMAKPDGRFRIDDVPTSTYTVAVSMMGYGTQTRENVRVGPNETTELRFEMEETVVLVVGVVDVTAQKPMVDVDKTSTSHDVNIPDVEVRSVDTIEEVLATMPGIVLEQNELHVRGSRAGEAKRIVDGVPIDDAFVGATGLDVSLVSLSDIEVLTGGFDAEFGNAQAAVINLKTKEGGAQYEGTVKYMTDDYGAPDKTYFNFDHLAMGAGGPMLTSDLRFFVSGEAVFSDTYLKTLEPRQQKELWGFIKFRERQTNSYTGQAKLSYKFSPTKKLSAELLASGERYDVYNHALSRIGYWSEVNRHWWFEPLDETYSLYVGPAHMPDVSNDHRSLKLVWNHNLGTASYYTLRLGRYTTLHKEAVLDKEPWQYFTPNINARLDPENRYFMVQGDHPHWQRYHTTMWTGKGDMTIQKSTTHQIKFGGETHMYRLEMEDILYASIDNPVGTFTDIYKYHCWGFSAFIQDRIKFEGMNVRAGLRLDLFDPGRSAVDAYNDFIVSTGFDPNSTSFFKRTEWQVSPRLGVSYPISERDALYFNYGRFYQMPRLEALFQFLRPEESGLQPFGNPLMDAETTVMYEVGIQRQMTKTIVGDIALFYKDIFGLTGTEAGLLTEDCPFRQKYGPTVTPTVYVNLDYGSVRGIELKLSKRFSNRIAGNLTYTFSEATGSSSNELQGANVVAGGLDRAPITELPLNWDRNHVISANLYISQPGLWGCNIDWSYASGAPYTPVMPREREIRAALINSERLPARSVLDIKADKQYRIAGKEVSLFLEGRNVLDESNVAALAPGGFPGGNGNYTPYYTTESEMGGAYDRGELLGLSDVIFVPLKDPRVYAPPRNFRVGFSFDI